MCLFSVKQAIASNRKRKAFWSVLYENDVQQITVIFYSFQLVSSLIRNFVTTNYFHADVYFFGGKLMGRSDAITRVFPYLKARF